MSKVASLFSNRSIAAKLALVTIVSAIFTMLVAVTILLIARGQLLTERAEKTHAVVDAVWSLADAYQRAAADGQMSEEDAKKQFFFAANNVWYENRVNYVFIYDYETGICVSNPGVKSFIGQNMREKKDAFGLPFAAMLMDMARQGEGSLRYSFLRGAADPTPLDKVAYSRGFAPWHLMIASATYVGEVEATFWSMVKTASVMIGILMVLSTALALFVTRGVIRPLSALGDRMADLSRGALAAPVPHIDRTDEIGQMARTVQVFKEAMLDAERLRKERFESQERFASERKADMNRLADQFESEVRKIVDLVSLAAGQLELSSNSLTQTAETFEHASHHASGASMDAAANVQSVAAASEELAASIGEITRQVTVSTQIASEAVAQSSKTDTRMAQLSEAAGRIGDVVDLIQLIAGQTNLLALNATIEAARAGDAGRRVCGRRNRGQVAGSANGQGDGRDWPANCWHTVCHP